MASAWASVNGLALGQRKVDDKSNEISAIPELLELLRIKGCIVTLDAMAVRSRSPKRFAISKQIMFGCQRHQRQLRQDIEQWFAYADEIAFEGLDHDYFRTVNKGHGRIEIRQCWTISDPLVV